MAATWVTPAEPKCDRHFGYRTYNAQHHDFDDALLYGARDALRALVAVGDERLAACSTRLRLTSTTRHSGCSMRRWSPPEGPRRPRSSCWARATTASSAATHQHVVERPRARDRHRAAAVRRAGRGAGGLYRVFGPSSSHGPSATVRSRCSRRCRRLSSPGAGRGRLRELRAAFGDEAATPHGDRGRRNRSSHPRRLRSG